MKELPGAAVGMIITVVICVVVGVTSVIGLKGDNPVENAANAVINHELGINIDISDMMSEFHNEADQANK